MNFSRRNTFIEVVYTEHKILKVLFLTKAYSTVKYRARSTDREKATANQWFRHSDLVTDFVTVILSQSERLSKMALGIVKYAYDRSSQLIVVIWFAVSCRGP